jgi:hypothetical protein
MTNSEAWGGNTAPGPTLNVERLNELADFIDGTKRVPFRDGQPVCKSIRKPAKWFNMATWFRKMSRMGRNGPVDCGSVGCIAGWARDIYGSGKGEALKEGQQLLGLTSDQADALFFAHGIARKSLISPHRAAKVLRRLAKTGEVDWSKR